MDPAPTPKKLTALWEKGEKPPFGSITRRPRPKISPASSSNSRPTTATVSSARPRPLELFVGAGLANSSAELLGP